MTTARALLVAALATLAFTACTDDPGGDPPIDGLWTVKRAVVDATAGCPALTLDDFSIDVQHDDTAKVTVIGGPALYQLDEVTDTTATFSTIEHAFSEFSDQAIVVHEIEVNGNNLNGTATIHGDGENLGCTWTVDVTGGTEVIACLAGGCVS